MHLSLLQSRFFSFFLTYSWKFVTHLHKFCKVLTCYIVRILMSFVRSTIFILDPNEEISWNSFKAWYKIGVTKVSLHIYSGDIEKNTNCCLCWSINCIGLELHWNWDSLWLLIPRDNKQLSWSEYHITFVIYDENVIEFVIMTSNTRPGRYLYIQGLTDLAGSRFQLVQTPRETSCTFYTSVYNASVRVYNNIVCLAI